MSTALKKILLLCGCFILIGGVAFYFYQQNKPDPEPVKIYNAPKRAPKQDPSAKISPVRAAPSEVTSIEASQTGKEKSLSETPKPSVTHTATSEKKEDVLSEEAIKKWVTEIVEELEQLSTRCMEKYPELFQISNMTKEEFLETYPTPESQQELLEYVQRVQPEMFAEISDVFSRVPIEIIEDILLEAKDHFVKTWGQEAADQVMSQLRTELGL